MAGLAGNASDALAMAGHDKGMPRGPQQLQAHKLLDALVPLLVSTSAHGLHIPLLIRMADLLSRIRSTLSNEHLHAVEPLECLINGFVSRRRSSFERPLFPDRHPTPPPPSSLKTVRVARPGDYEDARTLEGPMDMERLGALLGLDSDGTKALEGTVRRLEKGLRGSEAQSEEPRGVREL